MSEPVIPERWKDKYAYPFTYGSKAFRQLVEELGGAEAQVAELVAANEFAKTKYSAYRDEATAEYARYELMLAEQAATIERLTGAMKAAGECGAWLWPEDLSTRR